MPSSSTRLIRLRLVCLPCLHLTLAHIDCQLAPTRGPPMCRYRTTRVVSRSLPLSTPFQKALLARSLLVRRSDPSTRAARRRPPRARRAPTTARAKRRKRQRVPSRSAAARARPIWSWTTWPTMTRMAVRRRHADARGPSTRAPLRKTPLTARKSTFLCATPAPTARTVSALTLRRRPTGRQRRRHRRTARHARQARHSRRALACPTRHRRKCICISSCRLRILACRPSPTSSVARATRRRRRMRPGRTPTR